MTTEPWYHFWHPGSGFIGGCIFWFVFSAIAAAITELARFLFT